MGSVNGNLGAIKKARIYAYCRVFRVFLRGARARPEEHCSREGSGERKRSWRDTHPEPRDAGATQELQMPDASG